MDCSVYAAQYLLEALFENGAEKTALALITADGDRSWKHMVNSGTTITWEAWDQKYKPNQDWNHAWGAAPANLLPPTSSVRGPPCPVGKRPPSAPAPGISTFAKGKVPTPRGPILIDWRIGDGFVLDLTLPEGMGAMVDVPAAVGSKEVWVNGVKADAAIKDGRWFLMNEVSGKLRIEVK